MTKKKKEKRKKKIQFSEEIHMADNSRKLHLLNTKSNSKRKQSGHKNAYD